MSKLWRTAKEYNALQEKFDTSQKEVARLQQDLDAANAASIPDGPTSEEIQTQMEDLNDQIQKVTADRNAIRVELDAMKKSSPGASRTGATTDPKTAETASSFIDPQTEAVYQHAQGLFDAINAKK